MNRNEAKIFTEGAKMTKKEIKNLLKAGRPKTVVKNYRRESTEFLEKFITDKDPDVQRNAIIAYGVVARKLGIARKQVIPFVDALEKIYSPENADVITETLEAMGDKALGPLIQKSASKNAEFYSGILNKIGSEAISDALLAEKITSPADALLSEIILRINTTFFPAKSVYDSKFQYGEKNIAEYKRIIKKAFSSQDPDKRHRALVASENYLTITREFANEIAKLLGKESQEFELKALHTLGELSNPDVISTIGKRLIGTSDDIKIAAVNALGAIGDPAGIQPLLKHSLLDDNEFVRQSTTNTLGKIGRPAADALINLLDKDQYVKQVEIALKRIGEPAVKPLVQAMGHKKTDIRKNATDLAKMILTTKYGFEGTVVKLLEHSRDRDEEVKEHIIQTIVDMGDPAIEAVIRALGNQDSSIRDNSRDTLERFSLMNIQLVVENAFKNLIAGIELIVLMSVFSLDDDIKDYAFAQLEALADNEEYLSASGAISQAVIDNVLTLNNVFNDSDDDVRYSVAQIGFHLGKPMVPHLIRFLSDKNEEIREVALDSIGYLGTNAYEAVDQISKLATSKNPAIRKSAITALGNIGHPTAVPILIESMGDEDVEIQKTASEALSNLENPIPVLIDSLSHKNPKTRENLVHFIKKLAQDVYSPLIERLTNNDSNFQEAASMLIGELGPDFGQILLSEVQLIPSDAAHFVAINGFGKLQYTPALPFLMDNLRKKDQKLTQAVHSTVPQFGETLVVQCLTELEQGGETMEKIIIDFFKTVDPKFLIAPVLVQISKQTPKKGELTNIMRKISDKDVNAKLISLLDINQLSQAQELAKIIESESELSKLAEKIGSTVPR